MTVFDRIKILAEKKLMTIAELERKADLGNGTIRRWDKSLPSADKLKKVGNILGVTIDYLVNGNDELSAKGIVLARNAENLSEKQLKLINDLIEQMKNKE